ncbi:MAG: hypothetical protein HYT16_00585 [DPANN group archaeon]|nr:hypothetical protein [DPANN group archaeon]
MAEKEDKKSAEKVKDNYEELRKKYGLPKFEEFNAEFEIVKADPELNFSRELRRAITNRLQAYSEWFEPVLNPNPNSLHSMVETKIFEKQELQPLFNLYKKLWHLVHVGLQASLQTEADEIKFVKHVWEEWPAVKKEILKYVGKLADGWLEQAKEPEDSGYVS